MKKRIVLMILGLIIALLSISVASSAQNNEVDTLVKAARFLEEKPLDKEAKKVRAWAMQWLIATDKVTVNLCSETLTFDKNYKYGTELFGQYAIGMGAFKLNNADKASDDGAAQVAGVESALTAYQAILAQQPKATNPLMNDLLTKRSDGTLATYVKEHSCQKKT
jgi:hypothetical protein